jgi:hypothetical protein
VSGPTLEKIDPEQMAALGVRAKRLRWPLFAQRPSGVPADITMYRLETRRQLPASRNKNSDTTSA